MNLLMTIAYVATKLSRPHDARYRMCHKNGLNPTISDGSQPCVRRQILIWPHNEHTHTD